MIVDRLANLGLYASVHPALPRIIAFIANNDLAAIKASRTELGDGLALLRESYLTRPYSDCTFEGHLRHADLQLVLAGEEAIGWVPRGTGAVKVLTPYAADKDVEKYAVSGFSRVGLSAGMFALVFPDDLHMPKLMQEETARVDKAVFKIAL
jgi:YhcH/YjgK/YiaL family protein